MPHVVTEAIEALAAHRRRLIDQTSVAIAPVSAASAATIGGSTMNIQNLRFEANVPYLFRVGKGLFIFFIRTRCRRHLDPDGRHILAGPGEWGLRQRLSLHRNSDNKPHQPPFAAWLAGNSL